MPRRAKGRRSCRFEHSLHCMMLSTSKKHVKPMHIQGPTCPACVLWEQETPSSARSDPLSCTLLHLRCQPQWLHLYPTQLALQADVIAATREKRTSWPQMGCAFESPEPIAFVATGAVPPTPCTPCRHAVSLVATIHAEHALLATATVHVTIIASTVNALVDCTADFMHAGRPV